MKRKRSSSDEKVSGCTKLAVPEYDPPDRNLPSPAGFNWRNALMAYLDPKTSDPIVKRSTFWGNDNFVVIYDKFPKARYHLLLVPRRKISGHRSLSSTDGLPLLKEMHELAAWIVDGLKKCDQSATFRFGYHANPSLSQLHLHIISQDFDSKCLKNKKHWNSFTSAFFIDSAVMIKAFRENGDVKFDIPHYEALLKQPLRCHRCSIQIKTIPKLKDHISKCNEQISVRRYGELVLEK
eukprot:896776_1